METPILLTHVASTLFMTGVIWVTQMTQYPSFLWFKEEGFARKHDKYRSRMAFVATLPMTLEALSGLFLLIFPPAYIGGPENWTAFSLIAVIWISMFLVHVPLHSKLSRGFDAGAVRTLVATNWVRTAAWTLRSILVIRWLSEAVDR